MSAARPFQTSLLCLLAAPHLECWPGAEYFVTEFTPSLAFAGIDWFGYVITGDQSPA